MLETLTTSSSNHGERAFTYRLLRYVPNLVRDEWVNIGVLIFDSETGERRLRMIEDQGEFARVLRLHPSADQAVLRGLREHLESRFDSVEGYNGSSIDWQEVLAKWDSTLAEAVQFAQPKGLLGGDLDEELERLYTDHVTPQKAWRVGAPGSRAYIRKYCSQVWKQAQLWGKLEKSVRVAEYTFPGDPMRIDYSYRRNGTRGCVQTLSVSRAPSDCKLYAYTAERIAARAPFASEFTAVTDLALQDNNERHRFVSDTLRDAGIDPVPMEGFAVWVAKLKPLIQ